MSFVDHIDEERARMREANHDQTLAAFMAASEAMERSINAHGLFGTHFVQESLMRVQSALDNARATEWREADREFECRLNVPKGGGGLRKLHVVREKTRVYPDGRRAVVARIIDGPSKGRWVSADIDENSGTWARGHGHFISAKEGIMLGDEAFYPGKKE